MRVDVPEAIRPTLRAAVFLSLVFLAGTVGYFVLAAEDQSWLDALYMTTITLTTVGYDEVVTVSGRPAAEIFTVLLMLSGVGTFVYFFSQMTAFLVEGTLHDLFRRRRMERWIDRLEDHHVVCGGGHSGIVVVQELLETQRPFVLVEENEERAGELRERIGVDFPLVVGDATEDEVLTAAGIERARSLVSCIGNDKDNVLVVFTARNLRPDLRIVARSLDASYEAKLRRAGADAVVSPERIGGLRLVSETVRPTAVSFLDLMLRDPQEWRVEEAVVEAGSSLEGASVAGLGGLGVDEVLVMAIRQGDGRWVFNPDRTLPLTAGTGVIFLGRPESRVAMERVASA